MIDGSLPNKNPTNLGTVWLQHNVTSGVHKHKMDYKWIPDGNDLYVLMAEKADMMTFFQTNLSISEQPYHYTI